MRRKLSTDLFFQCVWINIFFLFLFRSFRLHWVDFLLSACKHRHPFRNFIKSKFVYICGFAKLYCAISFSFLFDAVKFLLLFYILICWICGYKTCVAVRIFLFIEINVSNAAINDQQSCISLSVFGDLLTLFCICSHTLAFCSFTRSGSVGRLPFANVAKRSNSCCI